MWGSWVPIIIVLLRIWCAGWCGPVQTELYLESMDGWKYKKGPSFLRKNKVWQLCANHHSSICVDLYWPDPILGFIFKVFPALHAGDHGSSYFPLWLCYSRLRRMVSGLSSLKTHVLPIRAWKIRGIDLFLLIGGPSIFCPHGAWTQPKKSSNFLL